MFWTMPQSEPASSGMELRIVKLSFNAHLWDKGSDASGVSDPFARWAVSQRNLKTKEHWDKFEKTLGWLWDIFWIRDRMPRWGRKFLKCLNHIIFPPNVSSLQRWLIKQNISRTLCQLNQIKHQAFSKIPPLLCLLALGSWYKSFETQDYAAMSNILNCLFSRVVLGEYCRTTQVKVLLSAHLLQAHKRGSKSYIPKKSETI